MFSNITRGLGKLLTGTPRSTAALIKDAILAGDEDSAISIYTSGKIGDCNPNEVVSINSKKRMSLLQLSAEHAFFHLLSIFLSWGGDPRLTNDQHKNALHCVCSQSNELEPRSAIVEMLLHWRSPEVDGFREAISINAVDCDGNSALHLAACKGLVAISGYLIREGAIASLVNKDQLTCCELAERCGNLDLSAMLELAIVFQPKDCTADLLDDHDYSRRGIEIPPLFADCRSIEQCNLQTFIDNAISIISSAPLGFSIAEQTAEALLHANNWDTETVLAALHSNPEMLFKSAHLCFLPSTPSASTTVEIISDTPCEICGDPMRAPLLTGTDYRASDYVTGTEGNADDVDILRRPLICSGGKHIYCISCWSTHVSTQIRDNGAFTLQCPGFQCGAILNEKWANILLKDPPLIEMLRRQHHRYVVDCCPTLKLCPRECCSLVLQIPTRIQELNSSLLEREYCNTFAKSTICRNYHAICWNCDDEAHSPCSCREWRNWKGRVTEELSVIDLSNSGKQSIDGEDIANAIWVATNTKKCPRCHCLIEKDEGCNHMSCRKCRYEFCWICMQSWSLHGAETGGYFQCNRFTAESTANQGGSSSNEAVRMKIKGQRVAWFLHHYSRFKAHSDSLTLETSMHLVTIQRILREQLQTTNGQLVWLQGHIVGNPLDTFDVPNEKWPSIDELSTIFRRTVHKEYYPFGSAPKSSISCSKSGASEPKRATKSWFFPFRDTNTTLENKSAPSESILQGDDVLGSLDSEEWIEVARKHLEFLDNGFGELIKCRYLLRGLAVFSFSTFSEDGSVGEDDLTSDLAAVFGEALVKASYPQKRSIMRAISDRKRDLDVIQAELEMIVEMLSDILARKRLRAANFQVEQATSAARLKRIELEHMLCDWVLSLAILRDDILVSNPTSMTTRHVPRQHGRSTRSRPHRAVGRDSLEEDDLPHSSGSHEASWLEDDSDISTQLALLSDMIGRMVSTSTSLTAATGQADQTLGLDFLSTQGTDNRGGNEGIETQSSLPENVADDAIDIDEVELNSAILMSIQSLPNFRPGNAFIDDNALRPATTFLRSAVLSEKQEDMVATQSEELSLLVSAGFDREKAHAALCKCNQDVHSALELLLRES